MKNALKVPSNPKFYLGHSTTPNYEEVDCLFTYNKKSVRAKYLIESKKGAKESYYLDEANKLYQEELKSGKLAKKAKYLSNPHFYRNRHLIIGGTVLVVGGLVALTMVLLLKHFKHSNFEYLLKSDGTYEISKYDGDVENLIIPETYNGAPVTSIANYTFAQHHEIKTISLSNNLISIGYKTFFDNTSLTKVSFTEANQEPSLKDIGSTAFCGCYNLKDIYLPTSLHTIGTFAFQFDRAINELFIPRNVYAIEQDAFTGCNNAVFYIESSVIPPTWSSKWNGANRPYILDSTRDTPNKLVYKNNLIYVRREDANDESYAEIVGYYENETQKLPELCDIPETITMGNDEVPVKAINANAFATAPTGNVRWLTIPKSVTHIGANAFKGLTNTLVFVKSDAVISDWEDGWNNGVLKTYEGFTRFEEIEQRITLAHVNGGGYEVILDAQPTDVGVLNLNSIGDEIAPKAFANRDDIKSVKVTEEIGDFAFANCRNLTTLEYDNYVDDIYIGKYAFYISKYEEGRNGVTDITLQTDNNLTIDDYAFQKGSGTNNPVIENLVINKGNTGTLKFGDGVFTNCSFKENTTITFDEHMDKPGRALFQNADETFTINVNPSLFTKMQDEWNWPVDVEKTLSLHKSADGTYYQLYTKWPTTEPAYDRFGKAHIVVNS